VVRAEASIVGSVLGITEAAVATTTGTGTTTATSAGTAATQTGSAKGLACDAASLGLFAGVAAAVGVVFAL